jgi:hypothetical protein
MASGLGVAGAAVCGVRPLPAAAEETGWRADPEVIARNEAEHPGFIFRESQVPDYQLPDPLLASDRTRVTSVRDWWARRDELLDLFRSEVYGRRPGAARHPDGGFDVIEHDPSAMDGAATLKRVAVRTEHKGRQHSFEVIIFTPNAATGPVPVFLLLNNRGPENTDPTRAVKSPFWPAEQVIADGYAIAALQVEDLAPDDPGTFTDGIIGLYERPKTKRRPASAWGALSAWGLGGSRALDYFETDADLDAGRAVVVGHSRGGKAALWAAAEDQRFAMAVSNDSGCGGAALSRRRFGETVAEINRNFPHWFCRAFHGYSDNEPALPVDQHELIALLAPRAVCVASADEDLWADPRGEFGSLAAASPVYAMWGHEEIEPSAMPALDSPLNRGPRHYHIRRGGHDLTSQDWAYYTAMAEDLWRRPHQPLR